MNKVILFLAISIAGFAATSTPAVVGSARAGASISLTGSSSTCSPSCASYTWSQVSGPTALVWSSRTVATPIVRGAVFGEYKIRLVVANTGATDTATADLTFGAVPVDSKGITVADPRPIFAQVVGSSVPFGLGVWPELDAKQKELADLYGGLQSTDYAAFWETDSPRAGTITIDSNTDTAIVGSGTAFTTDFNCDGNTDATPDDYHYIVVRYTQSGRTRYHAKLITACADATHLTWSYTENMPAGTWQYTRATPNQAFLWTNQKTNTQYYDNVLAFYRLYARTGLTKYRDHARWLASKWITQPWYTLGEQDGDGMSASGRMHQLIGIMLYAEDGHPEVWGYLDLLLDRFDGYLNATTGLPIVDPREEAFFLWYVALAAKFHPVQGKKDAHAAAVRAALTNRWAASRDASGVWLSHYTDTGDTSGPVTISAPRAVTSGSAIFQAGDCGSQKLIWFVGDTVAYGCTYNSSTSITLTSDYVGAAGSKRFQNTRLSQGGGSGLLGPGVSPFYQGIIAQALYAAYLVEGDSRIPGWISGISQWLQSNGYKSSVKGWWYGRVFAGCEPDPSAYTWCDMGPDNDSSRRGLWGEIFIAMAYARQLDSANTAASWLDTGIGVNFGGGGGPSTSDGWSAGDLATGWINATKKAKDHGFYFGIGGASQILQARIGTPVTQTLRTMIVEPNRPAAADSTTITVTDPSGSTRSTTCTTAKCAIQVDARQGGEAQLAFTHTASGGAVTIASATIGLIQ